MTIAVICVPAGHLATYATQCLDYCADKGYDVIGVVAGDVAAAIAMLLNHTAGVLVLARPEHLDTHVEADIEPRIEFAAPADDPAGRPADRRTRIIPQGGGA